MNKARRKQIMEVVEKLRPLKEELESIAADEQEYFENMPESLQGSERGQQAEETMYELDTQHETLDEIIDALTEVVG